MNIKAVIFDLDGTLIDTERLFSKCLIKAASEEGWELEMDTIIDCVGTNSIETEQIVKSVKGQDYPYDRIREKGVMLFREYVEQNGIPFKAGSLRLLDLLDEKKIPFGIGTSTARRDVDEILIYAGIKQRFTTIVCGDEVEKCKPNPEVYIKAAANMDIPISETLIFEDSEHGVNAAVSAGARVVWIPDLQEIPDELRDRCFSEIGSLDAVCDRLGELVG